MRHRSSDDGRNQRTTSGWSRLAADAFRVASATHLVDRDASREVAQEALLTFCSLPQEPRSPIAWLRVVVRRMIWRRLDRTRLEREASLEYLAATRPDDSLSIEDRLALDEIRDRLPERSRNILGYVRDGLTHSEIAHFVGCELHQVGPRIARALNVARRRARRELER
jgi:DNA-directed RNA polymerase specialized sigma24 family protein